jgi:hypothetical protein
MGRFRPLGFWLPASISVLGETVGERGW